MASLPVLATKAAAVPKIIWLILILVAVAALSVFSWYSGYSVGKRSILEARIESQAQTAVAVAEQTKITTNTVIEYVDRIQKVHGKTRTIIKEVKVHVKDDCVLSPDWRLLHDKAAAPGAVSSPAGKTDGRTDTASAIARHGGN